MKVKFVGFGGYMETPCYEDENGRLYFDENNGKNGLNLYTGAYREEWGEICGEPNMKVREDIECDEPFVRHLRELDYMMLGRLESDCKYFLCNGNGYEGHLYYKEANEHCNEMKKLYESFLDEDKPEWISLEEIEKYRKEMLEKRRK